MLYGVLGPLLVQRDDGVHLPVHGSRRQAVLAALLAARGGAVRADALVEALWEGTPTPAAATSLQTYVSRLRTVLGPEAVVFGPGGYRLVVAGDEIDLVRFEGLSARGARALREDDPVDAQTLLREALDLWRGPAFEGFADLSLTRPEAARAEERRLTAEELLCDAELRLGRPADALDVLARLVGQHPLREEARRLHALALYRSGRQADALASLADGRRVLQDELGLDPGRPLQDLEQRILRQDPSLDLAPSPSPEPRSRTAAAPPPAPGPAPAWSAAPRSVLCPVLVGRAAEVAALRSAQERAGTGKGGTVVVLAPAGCGKSRLVREVLGRGDDVLPGRAVPAPVPVPFRPLVEALQAGLRRRERPPDVGPYRSALGRLVPEWHDAAVPAPPLPHLAEGVLRMLRGLTGGRPVTLLVEDLHWADEETLAVLEYLSDNLEDERLLLVLTARSEEGPKALELLHHLEVRRSATVLRLPPLDGDEVRTMVTACLGQEPADDVTSLVVDRAQGVPLFVEELLAVPGGPGPVVPASFSQAVRARTAVLLPDDLRVLQAAAVLGRRFDWRLLAPIVGASSDEVLAALRTAADLQLVQTVADELRFRHALHRDAVLADLLPPERSSLAAAALAALRAAAPGLPGATCQQAADLAEQAGDVDSAVTLLLEAGRRAADGGALRTAELLLDRALRLAPPAARTDVELLLLDVVVRAARCDRARDIGEQLLARLDRQGDRRRAAEVLVGMAEAATAAADHGVARAYLTRARPLSSDPRLRLRADLAAAECDVADRHPGAEERATDVAERARRLQEAELEERALLLVGRCRRTYDLELAEETFALVHARAVADGDPLRAVRALAELGSVDLLRGAPTDRLVRAAEEAEALGAVAIAGISRLHAAITHSMRAERQPGLQRAREARELADRYDLPVLRRGCLVAEASLHGLVGDLGAVGATVAADGPEDDSEWPARAWGNGWAVAFLSLERREEALHALRRARAAGAVLSGQSPLRPLSALLEAVDNGADVFATTPPSYWSAVAPEGLMAATAAVLAGRRGRVREAEEHYRQARALLRPMPWYQHVSARLVAERALVDGWGDPGSWLAEAAVWLDRNGVPAVAAACRELIRGTAGADPVRVPAASSGG